MMDISVAAVEARSGIEKETGETTAEYLRRVGDRTDLPDEEVEAVIDEHQRRRFAADTSTAGREVPIEEFLAAVNALGDDAPDETTVSEEADVPEPTDTERSSETAVDGATSSGTETTDPTETDSTDTEDAGGLAFYRSAAVVGVVVLLAAGLLGSTLLLVTDLGPSMGDEPETPADTDDLEETGSNADESDDGDDSADDDANEPDETATTETGDDSADADDEPAETPTDDGGDSDGNDTADDEPSEPIGFGEDDARNETEPDGPVGENDTDTGVGNGTDGTNGDAGGTNETDATDDGSGFGSDETTADDETETGSDSESEDDDPEVIDSAPEATGTLEVTDRAAPGDHPADEYVELTNVGDAPLDMSGWTVRDRDGGAVDTHGIEPLAFPDGFVLEPDASVRLVTGSGENTSETIYWGHVRQNWRDAGDVVVVADADGEEVLRHPYGDQAEA